MSLIITVGRKYAKMKGKAYWDPSMKIMRFTVHFIVVMVLLYCSALVFAKLEDPEAEHHIQRKNTTTIAHVNNRHRRDAGTGVTDLLSNISFFWGTMEVRYNFTLPSEVRHDFLKDLETYLLQSQQDMDFAEPRFHSHGSHASNDTIENEEEYIFMKWFYFVIIATMTIGYGHVSPQTDNGKLFYIFFSIVGIVLMMTLLKSCGTILMETNKKIYALVCHWVCLEKKYVSDELMSVISMVLIFLLFMLLVVWHDKNIGELKGWSWIDTFYFWLVTFTTVGFGDVHFPLKVEIEHFYELVVYRVFGLSFLSAIIDSILLYIKYRKELLIRKNRDKIRRISQFIISGISPLSLQMIRGTETEEEAKNLKYRK